MHDPVALPRTSATAFWQSVIDAVRHKVRGVATPADRGLLRTLGLVAHPSASNYVYRLHHRGSDYQLKLYRRDDPRDRARREWSALSLLAERDHSGAPRPVYCDLDEALPAGVMGRLAGRSFVGQVLGRRRLRALAVALQELHRITPETVDERCRDRFPYWRAPEPLVPAWLSEVDPTGLDSVCRDVVTLAQAWLRGSDPDVLRREMPHVFACMDCNGSNWLWDGERLAIVDYEGVVRATVTPFSNHASPPPSRRTATIGVEGGANAARVVQCAGSAGSSTQEKAGDRANRSAPVTATWKRVGGRRSGARVA